MTEVKMFNPGKAETAVDEADGTCIRRPGMRIADRTTFKDGWCHAGGLDSVDGERFLPLGRARQGHE